jgi:hypothetical protein
VPGEECLAAGLVDELVLIVWPGHPWARRREILSADLESTSSTVPSVRRAGCPARDCHLGAPCVA